MWFATCIADFFGLIFAQLGMTSERKQLGLSILYGAPSRRLALRSSQSDDEATVNTSSNIHTANLDLRLHTVDNENLDKIAVTKSEPHRAPHISISKTSDTSQSLVIVKNEISSGIDR